MKGVASSGTEKTGSSRSDSDAVEARTRPGAGSISFLGPAGTFTEEALFTQPDLAGAEVVPVPLRNRETAEPGAAGFRHVLTHFPHIFGAAPVL